MEIVQKYQPIIKGLLNQPRIISVLDEANHVVDPDLFHDVDAVVANGVFADA